MILKWTLPRALNIYVKPKKTDPLKGVTISPGNNELTSKEWALYKQNKTVKIMLEESKLIVISEDDEGLLKMDTSKAESVVSETYKEDHLEDWQDKEERKEVKKAIRKQKKMIEDRAKPQKKDED